MLAAWAITRIGRKVLVGLSPGTKESTDGCREFFEDRKRRRPDDPILAAADGAPGLIRGIKACFPRSLRQRSLAYGMLDIRAKVPQEIRAESRQAG